MSLPGYDAWLERPYEKYYGGGDPPPDIEPLLDTEFWYDGYRAVVESWSDWEDEDEDGRYGGTDLVLCIGGERSKYGGWTGGREEHIAPDDLREILAKQDEHKPEEEA